MADIKIRAPYLWTLSTIWPPICAIAVGARFIVRKHLKSPIGWDDWLTLPALVLVFGMAITIFIGTAQHAVGYPTPRPPSGVDKSYSTSPQQTAARKSYWSITLIQLVALTFIKVSCMLFYRRVFCAKANRKLRWVIDGINVILVLWGISFFFAWLFGCVAHFYYPFQSLMDTMKCGMNFVKVNLAISISDTILDLVVFAFPIPMVMRLQMSTVRKLTLLAVFSLGAAAIAASIVRLVVIVLILGAQYQAEGDLNFGSTAGIYFMFAEACFGLCAICLPTLAGLSKVPTIQRLISRTHSRSPNSSTTQSIGNIREQNEKFDDPSVEADSLGSGDVSMAGILTK